MRKTKKLVFMSLLTAVSLVIWVVEAQIPALVSVPGVKLGLANIITLVAMATLGRREAGDILCVRVILGSLFASSPSAFIFSFVGGTAAWLVMALTMGLFPEKKLWIVSVFGALAHNVGQLVAAAVVTKTAGVFWYAPALAASGVITGAFIGLIAVLLVPRVRPFTDKLKEPTEEEENEET